MLTNLELWNKLRTPPADALKAITGGRLVGKSDIDPQWRDQIMTEIFGPCGEGWKYTIHDKQILPIQDGQVMCFITVALSVKQNGDWGEPIYHIGGDMLVEKEKAGLHANDEGFKGALTDALGKAMAKLGVAADVYRGKMDGSKYARQESRPPKQEPMPQPIGHTDLSQFGIDPSDKPEPLTPPIDGDPRRHFMDLCEEYSRRTQTPIDDVVKQATHWVNPNTGKVREVSNIWDKYKSGSYAGQYVISDKGLGACTGQIHKMLEGVNRE